ncbi:MAG: amidohydrolase family protein [Candidatus Dormibacteraeota bacterium]|nr:amidohydrolase family protein [Candidatus Dormibacteraeota bacterium]
MTLVVDGHQHFWDPARHNYPWMSDELATIRRRFGPEDLRPLLVANGVDRTVVVQTISSLVETRELLATAAATDFVAGVVGWVDLTDPSLATTLTQLRAAPGGSFLVGIRHQVHDEADAGWLLRKDVLRGIQAVGEAGLVYDLLVRTRELPAAFDVVRRLPEVRFVIDHLAKPRIAAGAVDSDWERAMAPLSDCANVACKLSGMVTEASWTGWTSGDLVPYIRHALGWFGPERCVFGSDWPVCLMAATYRQVLEAMKYSMSDLEPPDQEAVFGGNAIRVYGLTG